MQADMWPVIRTSNALVQVPLGLLAIASAQRLSVWRMQKAVVIQGRFSVKWSMSTINRQKHPKKELPVTVYFTLHSVSFLQVNCIPSVIKTLHTTSNMYLWARHCMGKIIYCQG